MRKAFPFGLLGILFFAGIALAGTFYTSWNDIDDVGGVGDYELFVNPCSSGNTLIAVEVQRVPATGASFMYSGTKYDGLIFGKYSHIRGPYFTGSTQKGVFCKNTENSGGCIDYQVRFLCNTPTQPVSQTGILIVQSADTVTGINAYRGSTGLTIQKFNMFSTGTTIKTYNISILYSGYTISGYLTSFSNVKAYYYQGSGLLSTQSCSLTGGMYICPSSLSIPVGTTINAQIRADIPTYATGISNILLNSIVAQNQSGVSQQVTGLPILSPTIYIR